MCVCHRRVRYSIVLSQAPMYIIRQVSEHNA